MKKLLTAMVVLAGLILYAQADACTVTVTGKAASADGGEFHHPYYSLRRVWRAQSLVSPSLNLPAWVEGAFTKTYPFSIKPDQMVETFRTPLHKIQ
jgi:dipeptidase